VLAAGEAAATRGIGHVRFEFGYAREIAFVGCGRSDMVGPAEAAGVLRALAAAVRGRYRGCASVVPSRGAPTAVVSYRRRRAHRCARSDTDDEDKDTEHLLKVYVSVVNTLRSSRFCYIIHTLPIKKKTATGT
jgi:hypothetical protein